MFGRSQSCRERNQTPVAWMAVPSGNSIRHRSGLSVTRRGRAIQSKLIAMSEDFVSAVRLEHADVDEFGIQYTLLCVLKVEACALLKKRRELQSAVARG